MFEIFKSFSVINLKFTMALR